MKDNVETIRCRGLTERLTSPINFVFSQKLPLFSAGDPDPSDPYVFGPPGSGSGSFSQRYESGSFFHQAKIVGKTLT
jgi:hypothetical protein